jgi:hypothetical protein
MSSSSELHHETLQLGFDGNMGCADALMRWVLLAAGRCFRRLR